MSNKTQDPAAAEGAGTAAEGADAPEGTGLPKDRKNPAGKAAGGGAGVYVHKFRTPFVYEGVTYETLNFDFERLTGRDMIAVENEMQASNEYALDPLLSRNFQGKMAARAGGIGVDALEAMPMREFNKITNAARNFLIADSGA